MLTARATNRSHRRLEMGADDTLPSLQPARSYWRAFTPSWRAKPPALPGAAGTQQEV